LSANWCHMKLINVLADTWRGCIARFFRPLFTVVLFLCSICLFQSHGAIRERGFTLLDTRFFPELRGPQFPLTASMLLEQRQTLFLAMQVTKSNREHFDSKGLVLRLRKTALSFRNGISVKPKPIEDWTRWAVAQGINDNLGVGIDLDFRRKHPSDFYQVFGVFKRAGVSVLYSPSGDRFIGGRVFGGATTAQWGAELFYEFCFTKIPVSMGCVARYDSYGTAEDVIFLSIAWRPLQYIRLQQHITNSRWESGLGCTIGPLWFLGTVGSAWEVERPIIHVKGGVVW